MRDEQPDLTKLVGLASMIRKKYGIMVDREPILLFNKETKKLVKIASWITAEEFASHRIHCPDIVFYSNENGTWILEDDGLIHHNKTAVVRKDKWRIDDYNNAHLKYIIIDEWSIIERDGLEEKPLVASQVFAEFERINDIKKIMKPAII